MYFPYLVSHVLLHVYGLRRVELEIDDVLSQARRAYLTYLLPVQFAEKVEQLDIDVNDPSSPASYSAMAVSVGNRACPLAG